MPQSVVWLSVAVVLFVEGTVQACPPLMECAMVVEGPGGKYGYMQMLCINDFAGPDERPFLRIGAFMMGPFSLRLSTPTDR